MVRLLAGLLLLVAIARPSVAGVYAFVSQNTGDPPLFGIVHPPGFNGAGGTLSLPICVVGGDAELAAAVQQAIALWNSRAPATGNCTKCMRVEDIPNRPPLGQHLQSVVLHELGHVLGLDHTNLILGGVSTSFTNSVDTINVSTGGDGVRGSSDDGHSPSPPNPNPARLIHWFRVADNNPIVVDAVVIEEATFTRARASLPSGHAWSTNANSDYRSTSPDDDTADLLGFPDSQAVMYSFLNEDLVYDELGADDTNTVRMAMTGMNKLAGDSDDYGYTFTYVTDCNQADIEASFVDPATDPDLNFGELGVAVLGVTGIPDPPDPTQHYFVRPASGNTKILVKLNERVTWDFKLVFDDGFESGDTSGWSTAVP